MTVEKNELRLSARYTIEAVFVITGRGLVFVGEAREGNIHTGDYMEFMAFGENRLRQINGISFGGKPGVNVIGLLIRCRDEKEIEELRRLTSFPVEALIYKQQ
ncbi:MAG: hypothetical protein JST26_03330 [Bacteroidetes bacterium]|nr:hypothetical protein [Bacteroidota bacterium]